MRAEALVAAKVKAPAPRTAAAAILLKVRRELTEN
jgi:hypothetical protein